MTTLGVFVRINASYQTRSFKLARNIRVFKTNIVKDKLDLPTPNQDEMICQTHAQTVRFVRNFG